MKHPVPLVREKETVIELSNRDSLLNRHVMFISRNVWSRELSFILVLVPLHMLTLWCNKLRCLVPIIHICHKNKFLFSPFSLSQFRPTWRHGTEFSFHRSSSPYLPDLYELSPPHDNISLPPHSSLFLLFLQTNTYIPHWLLMLPTSRLLTISNRQFHWAS